MDKPQNQVPSFDYEHYLKLLWQNKYLLIGMSIVIFLFWSFIIYKFFQPTIPELSAKVLLGINDPRAMSAVDENIGLAGTERLSIMRSRTFLEDIVKNKNLTLRLKDRYRNQVFDSVAVDSTAYQGNYEFRIEDNAYQIFYDSKSEGNIKFIEGKSQNLKFTNLPGIYLSFTENFINNPREFSFSISSIRSAVDGIIANLEFDALDRRRGTLVEVSLRGKDHPLITDLINTMADEFVKKNVEFKKRKTREVISVLKKQLASANHELEKAQKELKIFREKYPWVILRDNLISSVNEVSILETNVIETELILTNLKRLRFRFDNNSEDLTLILNEMLSYLAEDGVTTVSALQNELTILVNEKNRLEANFSEQHPMVINNKEKISRLSIKMYSTVLDLISRLEIEIKNNEAKISKLSYRLRSLPSKEQELADLKRREAINSDIYSSVLVRYNEAKIADAVEVGDIYVMDYGAVPIPSRSFHEFIRKIIIGFIFSLVSSIGIIILIDFFDESVKNSKDVELKLNLPILATLPIIGNLKEIPVQLEQENKFDPKLITSDYAPTVTNESFRTLRTKLLLSKKFNKSSIIVTSLDPGEGKSLISSNLAITFAQQKLPTILIDCDLRRGVMHHSFGCAKKPGLADFLVGNSDVTIEKVSDVIQDTHVPNLFLISSGLQIPNPSELLASEKMSKLIKVLKDNFSVLIFDTPPFEFIPDAVVLSNLIDQIVLVTLYGKTNLGKLSKKIDEFPTIKVKLAGAIINASSEIELKKYDSYSYYQY